MYNGLGHYFLVLGISIVLTYNKRHAAVSLYFFFSTISFFGILFCYISSDFSNYAYLSHFPLVFFENGYFERVKTMNYLPIP